MGGAMSALVPPFRTTVEGQGAKRRDGRAAWRRRQTLLQILKALTYIAYNYRYLKPRVLAFEKEPLTALQHDH